MSWWKSLFQKRPADVQLDNELRFHIEELTDANIAAGLSPEEARRRAVLEFGGRELIKEDLRDIHRISFLESALWNLRSASRFIRKSPSFSIAVILTLAIGIGANSAVFSAIDAVLLKPLPFPNGDELMKLEQYTPKIKSPQTFVAPLRVEDWNRMNSTFQAITGYYVENESETTGVLPERVTRAWVAPRFLQVWGISPALGRDFSPQEENFGGPRTVLISDRLWRRRFNADPSAIGKQLRLEGSTWTIIGILPSSFRFPVRNADLWSPVPVNSPYAQDRSSTWYTVIGRLKTAVTVGEAQANLSTVQTQLGVTFPKTDAELAVRIEPLKEATVGGVRSSLWVLFGSVSLLLLIACTNIAALFLARAIQRRHEISVRFSLGASRAAIVTQLLTEAFVLALAGAALGLLVASGTSQVFRSLAANLPRLDEIQLDWKIVLYSLASSIVATILCGLFPAIQATRRNLSGSLGQTGRGQVSGNHPAQWTMVGVQVSLAVTLLMGAGLLLRSFQELGRVSPGFELNNILTLRISANWGETVDFKGLTQRIDRTMEVLRNAPSVEAVATASVLPGVPQHYQTELRVSEGESDPNHKILAEGRWVSASYFETVRIPLIAGELCRQRLDSAEILVNRSFVNSYFSGQPPLGKHLSLVGNQFQLAPGKITGVVGDARESGLNREPEPTVYWCASAPIPDPFFLVRTGMAPMAETMRRKVHEIEPGRSVFDLMPLRDHLDDAFAENRLRTVLLSFFAATAVLLACIGLYGTLSYSVNTRRREVGLRLALGAYRGQIVKQFLLQGLEVSLIGCLAGCGLAIAFTRVLSDMLYGISATDPLTMSGVLLLVILVAAIASLEPAVRAASVEPMQVLRDE